MQSLMHLPDVIAFVSGDTLKEGVFSIPITRTLFSLVAISYLLTELSLERARYDAALYPKPTKSAYSGHNRRQCL